MKRIILCFSLFMAIVVLFASCMSSSTSSQNTVNTENYLLNADEAMNNNMEMEGQTISAENIDLLELTNVSINADISKSTLNILGEIAEATKIYPAMNKDISFNSYEKYNTYNSRYYALYHYVNQSQSVSIDTSGALNISDTDNLRYILFLSALLNDYADSVAYLGYKYSNATSITYPTILVVCFEYKELGYDTIYDYLDAALYEQTEKRIENAYWISFSDRSIFSLKEMANSVIPTNLYDSLFGNTITK